MVTLPVIFSGSRLRVLESPRMVTVALCGDSGLEVLCGGLGLAGSSWGDGLA